MEPRSIANMNGMLVPSPVRNNNNRGGNHSAPSTPSNNRRASALWIRTPEEPRDDEHSDSDNGDEDNDDENDFDWAAPLTPVPKTPAPEAIARFAANVSPDSESPSSVGSIDSEDQLTRDDDQDEEDKRKAMLMRTCPPKRTTFIEPGQGILGQPKEKDESIMMRLMAARRKSLQFAPKVGSPLAKTWKAWN